MTHTIALIDDDENILTSVSMALEAEGFAVRSYTNGEAGLEGVTGDLPDLVISDVKMPRVDGLEVLETLRRGPDTRLLPIILLTSKDDEVDQIVGLRLGADDYITKPFSQRLLIARIQALLRRGDMQQEKEDGAADTETGEKMIRGPLVLDDARHECSWGGQPVNLTVTEYLLLHVLAERPGHVRSREMLIDRAYGETIHVDDRTVDSHIKRIRNKIRAIDPDAGPIETVYGIGYKYKED